MNHWPPPSADDAPPAPAAPSATANPWWQRPFVLALVVAFVFAGAIALVAIGFVRAIGSESADPAPTTAATEVTSSTEPAESVTTDRGDATPTTPPVTTTPVTTTPRVQSAPPVPPTSDGTAPTVVVVTLPPTTTWQVLAVEPRIGVEINFEGRGEAGEPDSEWVKFVNRGSVAVDMTGWLVRDDGFDHGHVFEPLTLQPDASVTLFSGCGTPTNTERYICSDEVWNDDGDVVSLLNRSGVLIVQRHG